jgi:hypothetical protein
MVESFLARCYARGMRLKIISLNIAGFKDWNTREPQIVNFLDAEAAGAFIYRKFPRKLKYIVSLRTSWAVLANTYI